MAPQEPFITDPRLPIRTSAHVLSAERSASKGSSWAVHVVQKARFADLHVPDFLCARKKIGGRVQSLSCLLQRRSEEAEILRWVCP